MEDKEKLSYSAKVVGTTLAVLMVLSAGVYAVTVQESVENTLHMRGDQRSVNGFSAYKLGDTQSSQPQSFSTSQDEGTFGGLSTSYWGIRVFYKSPSSSEVEVTSGSPVAVVSRSSTGGPGYQSATWTPPEVNLAWNDSVIVRVYQSIGQDNYQEAAAFTTRRLNASKLNSEQWTVNYYTELQDTGGAFSTTTSPTFYWGDSSQDSRINGFNYSVARVESRQLEPSLEEETWPGQTFKQTVEVTCRASTCNSVVIVPEACSGSSCSSFTSGGNFGNLSWNASEYTIGQMNRLETVEKTFEVTADKEGSYRIRGSVNSSNVATGDTSSTLVDVDVADVRVTQLQHENLFEHGVDQYEVSDSIGFLNTTLTSQGGKAFNLTITPEFIDQTGTVVSWSPSETKECGNVSTGASCEKEFNNYQIPETAESGQYNFSITYDWQNFGPGLNDTYSFQLIDLREGFTSTISESTLYQVDSTYYNFTVRNRWNVSITDLNVSVNCPDAIQCQKKGTYSNSLAGNSQRKYSFNVTAPESADEGVYTVNTSVEYNNPDERKSWTQVESQNINVSRSPVLNVTDLKIYDVTGQQDKTSGGTLKDEGLNKTFNLSQKQENRSYRFNFTIVNNGLQNWSIEASDELLHQGLSSNWSVGNIWYTLPSGKNFSGGSFNSGEVSWKTDGGKLPYRDSNNTMHAAYVVNISQNSSEVFNQFFKVNDTSENAGSTDRHILDVKKYGFLSVQVTEPPADTTVRKDGFFVVNTTVTCTDGECGQVSVSSRYNESAVADTLIPETNSEPLYISGSNIAVCSSGLFSGENCSYSWKVNASGPLDTEHLIDANASSTFSQVSEVDSTDRNVRIEKVVRINVTWDSIDFGVLNPGEKKVPAKRNTEGYTLSVPEDSPPIDDLWVRAENMSAEGWKNPQTNESYVIPAGNLFYKLNVTSTREPLTNNYQQVTSDLRANDVLDSYYWLDIPQGIKSSGYTGNIYFKVNATS